MLRHKFIQSVAKVITNTFGEREQSSGEKEKEREEKEKKE